MTPEGARSERVRQNLHAVLAEITAACQRAGRQPSEVMLLPVTKYAEVDYVRYLHSAGARDFGESTIQEATRKREALGDLTDLRWHLVGHLQRNKVGRALTLFETLHSLDSFRLAEALDRRGAGGERLPLELFVEVNIAGEGTKMGIPPGEVLPFLGRLHSGTSLAPALAGLMTLAPRAENREDIRPFFRELRELRDRAVDAGLLPASAGLSMGMSGDFPVAIEEGATIVRVGSRLFDGLPLRRRG